MTAKQLKEFKAQEIPKNTRLMGLDIGTKTLGVAVSDSLQMLATPVTTIHRVKFTRDIKELKPLIKEFEIGGFILGWPMMMDGSERQRCDMVRSFADEMTNHPDIFGQRPFVAFWDERLSTETMDNFLDNTVDIRGKTHKKQIIDKLAAQFILQGALDYIESIKT